MSGSGDVRKRAAARDLAGRVLTVILALGLGACVGARSTAALHRALTGTTETQRVEQPGVSFTPTPGRSWTFLVRSTYQAALGAFGASEQETYVAAATVYQLPAGLTPPQFLAHVKRGRAEEPETGRFETVRNEEALDTSRKEVCVRHRTTTKDFGAKRGGDYTLVDYLGMNCIHPSVPTVGVFVELSRKAPTAAPADFDAEGARMLESVAFAPFR